MVREADRRSANAIEVLSRSMKELRHDYNCFWQRCCGQRHCSHATRIAAGRRFAQCCCPAQSDGHSAHSDAASGGTSPAACHYRELRRSTDLRPCRRRPLLTADNDHASPAPRGSRTRHPHHRPGRRPGRPHTHHTARDADAVAGPCRPGRRDRATTGWSGFRRPARLGRCRHCVTPASGPGHAGSSARRIPLAHAKPGGTRRRG